MKVAVSTLDNKASGEIELSPAIFGLPLRPDILQRVVEWQRAKARSGDHKTKGISEISGTTKKPHAQKGTGRARQGSLRSAQMRGGAVIFGPVVRSHEYSLPKKVRALGLKTALSAKLASGKLKVIESEELSDNKTRTLVKHCNVVALERVLFITGAEVNMNFKQASYNIKNLCVLPSMGANVLDILRYDELVLTRAAVQFLEKRLG